MCPEEVATMEDIEIVSLRIRGRGWAGVMVGMGGGKFRIARRRIDRTSSSRHRINSIRGISIR